jgi:N-acetylmuramoyl-L-alanine amidase
MIHVDGSTIGAAMKATRFRVCPPLGLMAAIVVMSISPSIWAGGTVVIDAGHGGKDPGTRSRTGVLEKDVNLAIALAVAAELRRQGVNVVLTRDSDVFVSLDNRAEIANKCGATLFVSIHCDFDKNASTKGFSVLIPRSGPEKASAAGHAIAEDLQSGGAQCHSIRRDHRGLRVLEKTHSPAVLIEVGFLSNPSEAAKLHHNAYRKTIGVSIAEGIAEYLQN